jgi:hypothetical protein
MSAIGIARSPEELENWHQEWRAGKSPYLYWKIHNFPTDVARGDLLWVASGGLWRGYYVISEVDAPSRQLRFLGDSWVERPGGSRSSFQGFTYHVPPP